MEIREMKYINSFRFAWLLKKRATNTKRPQRLLLPTGGPPFFMVCLLAVFGSLLGPDAKAGNLYLTGHDILHHEGQNGYDAVILDYLRDSRPKSGYHIGVIGTEKNGNASFTGSSQNVAGLEHKDPINLVGTTLTGYASATFYDAEKLAVEADRNSILNSLNVIIVLSHESAVGTSLTDAGVDAMIAMSDSIILAFNNGTDIWANSAGHSYDYKYYSFLGIPIKHQHLPGYNWNPPDAGFEATAEGQAIGIDTSMINGFPTHNRFLLYSHSLDFTVFEEHGTHDWIISIGMKDAYLPGRVRFSAGLAHSLAVKDNGTVWAWGSNYYGMLGDSGASGYYSTTPVQAFGAWDIHSVAAGGFHSLALKADGTVWSWGSNDHGQLGTTGYGRDYPAQVPGLSGVVAIAAGHEHSLALKSDGTVWIWGNNAAGSGGPSVSQVSSLSNIRAISAGDYHNLALKDDGTVLAWGSNWFGQLGNGQTGGTETTPVVVSNLTDIVAVSGGGSYLSYGGFSLAVKSDGTVWAWGYNGDGQHGNYSTTDSSTPVQTIVMGVPSDIISVSAGGSHVLAVRSDGGILSWGDNSYGQAGSPPSSPRLIPYSISSHFSLPVGTVSAGGLFSLAIDDSNMKAWGSNWNGELGDGTTTQRWQPGPVQSF